VAAKAAFPAFLSLLISDYPTAFESPFHTPYLPETDRSHSQPHADEKRSGDVLKVPGDPLDDVADDARYGIYTFVTTAEKPPELAIADAWRRLAEQGDLTSGRLRSATNRCSPNPKCSTSRSDWVVIVAEVEKCGGARPLELRR
jgi:hypothetical protein